MGSSSLSRDRARAPRTGSVESQPPDCQGSPRLVSAHGLPHPDPLQLPRWGAWGDLPEAPTAASSPAQKRSLTCCCRQRILNPFTGFYSFKQATALLRHNSHTPKFSLLKGYNSVVLSMLTECDHCRSQLFLSCRHESLWTCLLRASHASGAVSSLAFVPGFLDAAPCFKGSCMRQPVSVFQPFSWLSSYLITRLTACHLPVHQGWTFGCLHIWVTATLL